MDGWAHGVCLSEEKSSGLADSQIDAALASMPTTVAVNRTRGNRRSEASLAWGLELALAVGVVPLPVSFWTVGRPGPGPCEDGPGLTAGSHGTRPWCIFHSRWTISSAEEASTCVLHYSVLFSKTGTATGGDGKHRSLTCFFFLYSMLTYRFRPCMNDIHMRSVLAITPRHHLHWADCTRRQGRRRLRAAAGGHLHCRLCAVAIGRLADRPLEADSPFSCRGVGPGDRRRPRESRLRKRGGFSIRLVHPLRTMAHSSRLLRTWQFTSGPTPTEEGTMPGSSLSATCLQSLTLGEAVLVRNSRSASIS